MTDFIKTHLYTVRNDLVSNSTEGKTKSQVPAVHLNVLMSQEDFTNHGRSMGSEGRGLETQLSGSRMVASVHA